jgi:hypothetical protein
LQIVRLESIRHKITHQHIFNLKSTIHRQIVNITNLKFKSKKKHLQNVQPQVVQPQVVQPQVVQPQVVQPQVVQPQVVKIPMCEQKF